MPCFASDRPPKSCEAGPGRRLSLPMRIGIVAAGQLGRMMAFSGIPLGIDFTMYDRSADAPGASVAEIVTGEFDDSKKLARFARGVDVVTVDWENVPVASARAIAQIRPVWPPARALEVAQDRLFEKRLFQRLGMPVAPFAAVDSRSRSHPRDRASRGAWNPEDQAAWLRRQGTGDCAPPRGTRAMPGSGCAASRSSTNAS